MQFGVAAEEVELICTVELFEQGIEGEAAVFEGDNGQDLFMTLRLSLTMLFFSFWYADLVTLQPA